MAGSGNVIISYYVLKYVRKWCLLKRNKIICPEVAINGQFLPGKSNFFVKLPEKAKFFRNLPRKIEFLCV